MNTLTCIETYIDKNQNAYGSFLIEPLEIGQGITLGNALRRTLLSDLNGYGITGVRINNLKHEFAILEGVREDVLEILLNLKEIIFKASFLGKQEEIFPKFVGYLNVKGPMIVTAGMLQLPKEYLTILNPHLYICTLVDSSEFYLEIDIQQGKGYVLKEDRQKEEKQKTLLDGTQASTLLIDTLFLPIRKVKYKVKLIHDTKGNIKESLFLEILTNGSITPKRALQEASKMLVELVSLCLFSSDSPFLLESVQKKY